jgi:hypothetical protein
MDSTEHTANFLASYFLGSNISRKKIYGLKSCHWAIIRYICDSIDKNYRKRKKLETKLYQSQIAKFTYLSRKTVNVELQYLIKKRILRYISKNKLTIGKVLIACNVRLQRKEVLPQVTKDRYVTSGYTSNSSNLSNARFSKFEDQKQKSFTGVENQTTSYKKDTYMKKPLSESSKKAWEKARKAAGCLMKSQN